MDNTKYIALSRQMALWKQMDIVSNNMANMNTSGFKQDDAIFASYLTQTKNAEGFGQVPVYFTQDFGMYKDFREGVIQHTGNTFDLALQGDAFFAVETPEGERYTRKGQFQLNADGMLVTSEGYAVLSENNEPFFIAPGETEISITESGDVYTENGVIGTIKTVSFENTDGNMMQPADNTKVIQGAVEKSNVDPIVEMTKMIKLQRSYEMVQSMIDEEHERLSNTISTYSQLA